MKEKQIIDQKNKKHIMVWFLPVIVIGGIFFPLIGYLVVAMMAFFLPLSFFKGRYWCWNLCPKGAFLDIVVSKISRKKPVLKIITEKWPRLLILSATFLAAYLILVMLLKDSLVVVIGGVFVAICLSSTIVSFVLGVLTKPRTWCAVICPIGKLQDKISPMARKRK